ncbi:MAG: LysR family transcriptional regulator, partial [Rhodobacteraceae bacterium]|nr:LysR family transcriptional regulator [Paracoccaceae bacterium]
MQDRMPTLRQLRYFVALAQCGQYRRAAAQLGLSQPSLSQQIAALETVLGVRLVERGRRGVVLTPAGRDALRHAQTVLDDVAQLTGLSNAMAKGLTGTLHLGSTPTIGPYILPRLLQHLHADHPDLKLVARDGPPRDLLEDLLVGVHDMILSQLPVASAETLS